MVGVTANPGQRRPFKLGAAVRESSGSATDESTRPVGDLPPEDSFGDEGVGD